MLRLRIPPRGSSRNVLVAVASERCFRFSSRNSSSSRISASFCRICVESPIPMFVRISRCASGKPLARRAAIVLSPQALRAAISGASSSARRVWPGLSLVSCRRLATSVFTRFLLASRRSNKRSSPVIRNPRCPLSKSVIPVDGFHQLDSFLRVADPRVVILQPVREIVRDHRHRHQQRHAHQNSRSCDRVQRPCRPTVAPQGAEQTQTDQNEPYRRVYCHPGVIPEWKCNAFSRKYAVTVIAPNTATAAPSAPAVGRRHSLFLRNTTRNKAPSQANTKHSALEGDIRPRFACMPFSLISTWSMCQVPAEQVLHQGQRAHRYN